MVLRCVALALMCCVVLACDDDTQKKDADTVTCTPGALSCACTDSGGCDSGLVCDASSVCVSETGTTTGLVIATDTARACELLFEQTSGAELLSVRYGAATTGALKKREPNVALAISRTSDTPFESDSLSVVVEGAVADLPLTKVRCFDSAGAEIANADVQFTE